jgi:prenyltransferase beta subunit
MSSGTPSCALRLRRAARAGARSLSDAAQERVAGYLQGQRAPDGGFLGRNGASDLYYSLFALAALDALDRPLEWDPTARDQRSFGDGAPLDLVHTCCLARGLALAPGGRSRAAQVVLGLDEFVAPTGGYRPTRTAEGGSISASFVAQLAYDELELTPPARARIDDCIAARRCADGAWADAPGLATGTTTVTAAATLMRSTHGRCERTVARWLAERCAPAGGFLASARAPAPDLLSTAAALLALEAIDAPRKPFTDSAMAFVESLWTDEGGFPGYSADAQSDCEFTYYALVTVGVLAGEAA